MRYEDRPTPASDIAYLKRVAEIIADADKDAQMGYKGLTEGEVTRRMGEDGDRYLTHWSIQNLPVHEARLIPERYSFNPPEVRYVDRERWGQVVDVVPGYHINKKTIVIAKGAWT